MFVLFEKSNIFKFELNSLLRGWPCGFVCVFSNAKKVVEGNCAEVAYRAV